MSQANRLQEELLRLGGECVLTGGDRTDERVDAVLMGTLAQFTASSRPRVPLAWTRRCSIDRAGPPGEPRDRIVGSRSRSVVPVARPHRSHGDPERHPDSFHDGGEYDSVDDAVARAEAMVDAGVDVIDVGGESTRPGAKPVPTAAEIDRVVPVVERLADLDVSIAIDTRKAAVADAALEAGGDVVNDVSGLDDPEMRFVVADHDAGLVVMHSIDTPVVPDRKVVYDDVVEDVIDQLSERILLAEKAGVDRDRIVVDPGIGFGKSARESFEMLGRLEEFRALTVRSSSATPTSRCSPTSVATQTTASRRPSRRVPSLPTAAQTSFGSTTFRRTSRRSGRRWQRGTRSGSRGTDTISIGQYHRVRDPLSGSGGTRLQQSV